MAHENSTAAAIRAIIQERIQKLVVLDGDCHACEAPIPFATRSQNMGGSHWAVRLQLCDIPACDRAIFHVVSAVMTEYELCDEDRRSLVV